MRTRGEDGCLQARERGLRSNEPCRPHLDLKTVSLQNREKIHSCCLSRQSVVHCDSSLNRLPEPLPGTYQDRGCWWLGRLCRTGAGAGAGRATQPEEPGRGHLAGPWPSVPQDGELARSTWTLFPGGLGWRVLGGPGVSVSHECPLVASAVQRVCAAGALTFNLDCWTHSGILEGFLLLQLLLSLDQGLFVLADLPLLPPFKHLPSKVTSLCSAPCSEGALGWSPEDQVSSHSWAVTSPPFRQSNRGTNTYSHGMDPVPSLFPGSPWSHSSPVL